MKTRKTLILLLAAVLVLIAAVPAFADEEMTPKNGITEIDQLKFIECNPLIFITWLNCYGYVSLTFIVSVLESLLYFRMVYTDSQFTVGTHCYWQADAVVLCFFMCFSIGRVEEAACAVKVLRYDVSVRAASVEECVVIVGENIGISHQIEYFCSLTCIE